MLTLTKKGCGTAKFYEENGRYYIDFTGLGTIEVTKDQGNQKYKSLRQNGWELKAEAPKAPKTEKKQPKGQTWEFPGGFNREKYDQLMKENGWTWCDARGHIHTIKKHREDVYEMMGGKKVR